MRRPRHSDAEVLRVGTTVNDDEAAYNLMDSNGPGDSNGSRRPGLQNDPSLLNVPVWRDEPTNGLPGNDAAAYYMPPEDASVPSPKPLRRKTLSTTMSEIPDSTEEAFRLIEAGVDAENGGRYAVAMKSFLDAGEMLTRVGEVEDDPNVRYLLHQKAMDVLGWTESLANWIDSGKRGPVPRRFGRTVGTSVIGRSDNAPLVANVTRDDPTEFNTMYYTAVSTKKVRDFTNDGYRLRVVRYNRRPKLMVVITMYNEDEVELQLTLRKVANNVMYIQSQELPGYDNDLAWQNVLVCIVSDGRTKANSGTLNWLHSAGVFDEQAMMINAVGVDVQMHLFEYSLQLMHHRVVRGENGIAKIEEQDERYPPLQIVFALKEYNGGKLNSHEWYFNAFAEQIIPKYTVLLDVGTMPTKSAFYRLLAAMEANPNIGGVCGEIAVDRPIPNLCNWVIAAQHYEYKVSNILDKSMESVFGFISVLPGAFSAYRYEAIRGPPLEAYFKSLTTPMKDLGAFQGNMYLAEDRILCFEIVARDNCRWTLHYVKNAIARTDVPTNLVALIGQRRRWLNGSFFAILYTVAYWGRIYSRSGHGIFRKLCFMMQYFFNVVTVLLSWFLVSNFYLGIYFVVIRGMTDNNYGFVDTDDMPIWIQDTISYTFQITYAIFFLIQVLAGLGNKPKHFPWVYTLSAVYFGFVMIVAFILATLIFVSQEVFSTFTVVFATAILGVYFISSALHCELHHICMAFVQYFVLLPTTVNVLMTYSFCNLHDLSWGTKGLESSSGHGPKKEEDKKGTFDDVVAAKKAAEEAAKREAKEKDELEKAFNGFRTKLLFFWIVTNMMFIFGIQTFVEPNDYLTVLYVTIGFFNIWRLIGSTTFLVTYVADRLHSILCLKRKLKKEVDAERNYRESLTRRDLMMANSMHDQRNEYRRPLV